MDPLRTAVGLARTVQAAGVGVGPERTSRFVAAVTELDPSQRSQVYWAGRLTLCATDADLARYDAVFTAYFSGDRPPALRLLRLSRPQLVPCYDVATGSGPATEEETGEEAARLLAAASPTDVLRHRDVAGLTASERAALRRLLAAFAVPGQLRRSRRQRAAPRGRIDVARSTHELLRHGGEPVVLRYRAPRLRARRVVLLIDVSGSMSAYADALLRFAHAAARSPAAVEVFTIGTRLTRVTRELSSPDPDTAMAGLSDRILDWSGGTRLGELIKEFLDRWGQRGMARGAVVVVLSDGWERGNADVLGESMARLHRLAYRVVWANPRKARPGYAPLAAGMAAALPHVDDFVEGHSLAALEHLARVVAGATVVVGHA